MMRLQKMRSGKYSSGNLASLASTSDSLSDDDKIRLQLFLDVVSFGKQVGLILIFKIFEKFEAFFDSLAINMIIDQQQILQVELKNTRKML